jgi:hypothetical protein
MRDINAERAGVVENLKAVIIPRAIPVFWPGLETMIWPIGAMEDVNRQQRAY